MFSEYDSLITHLQQTVNGLRGTDDFFRVSSRYTGFVAVSAITGFEVQIKKLLIDYAGSINPILGKFAQKRFGRIDAKITRDNIKEYLSYFDDQLRTQFKAEVNSREDDKIREGSVKSSYANLIIWRHDFVHGGEIPNTPTLDESVAAYKLGKEVIFALKDVLTPERSPAG